MTSYLDGDPIWVIAGLRQSDPEDRAVTISSEVFAVAKSRQAAEDILYVHGRSVDSDVIDIWIEETTLVDW